MARHLVVPVALRQGFPAGIKVPPVLFFLVNSVILSLGLAVITMLWFTVGGLARSVGFFRYLRETLRDAKDDCRVMRPPTP